jgi:hypothetical protein
MKQLKFHPVADVFPLLKGAEFDALVESVKLKGLMNPITLHPDDGSIIDGRNRYRACLKAGVEPRFVTWDRKGSLTEFVVAQNVDRRMLDGTERALLGKQLEPLYAAEAKERQRLGGRPKKGEKRVTQVKEREPQAREKAAKAARTNPIYISDLKRIEREAPEIYAKIAGGEIELAVAKRLLHKVHTEQRAKLARPAIERVDLRVSSMDASLAKIRNLDYVLASHDAAAVPLYGELARLAKTALKPDGILCVMCRENDLPRIMGAMAKSMSYHWTIACLTTGGQAVQIWLALAQESGCNDTGRALRVHGEE